VESGLLLKVDVIENGDLSMFKVERWQKLKKEWKDTVMLIKHGNKIKKQQNFKVKLKCSNLL